MTPKDVELVRRLTEITDVPIKAFDSRVSRWWHPRVQRLLALLIESEAMRKKAEFLGSHSDIALSNGCNCCKKHYWTDFDWIAAKKKEILG